MERPFAVAVRLGVLLIAVGWLVALAGCSESATAGRDAAASDAAMSDSAVSDATAEAQTSDVGDGQDASFDSKPLDSATEDAQGTAVPIWSECLDTCDHVTDYGCREELVSGDPGFEECYRGECFRANVTEGPCGAESDAYCCNAFQTINTPDLSEFTVELRVKFNVLPLPTHGGCKVLRFHSSDTTADYGMNAAPVVMLSGPPERQFYWSPVDSGTLTVTDAVTHVVTGNGYCTAVSGQVYECTSPDSRIKIATTMNFVADQWRKLRTYVKWPTAVGASDGMMKFWIDDVLILTLSEVKDVQSGGESFRKLRVLPISEGSVPFYQYWDEIKIFEGYAPPVAE